MKKLTVNLDSTFKLQAINALNLEHYFSNKMNTKKRSRKNDVLVRQKFPFKFNTEMKTNST